MKLLSTASMFIMATMASAKYSNLRQQNLGAYAGFKNYKGIAHAEFNALKVLPEQFRFSLDNFTTANYSDSTRSQNWTSTADYFDGGDFYFTYPKGIVNTDGVYFEFGKPGGGQANDQIILAKATADGPTQCNNANLVWADIDLVDRNPALFGWDTAGAVGEALEFKCWPANPGEWVNETNPDSFAAVASAMDTSKCKGRNSGGASGDLEKYIVIALGRDHDAQCDWVAACDGVSDYGEYCADPLNKDTYPNNECNPGSCTACTNPCDTNTQYFEKTQSICGKDRLNAATTANKQNVADANMCINITTHKDDKKQYIKTGATATSNNEFAACPEKRRCNGTSLTDVCPNSADANFFNDGTGNGCIESGIGKETNATQTGVIDCTEGKFAGAETNCKDSAINKEPHANKGSEVDCAVGEVALKGGVCTKCEAGKFAGSIANTATYQAGKCDNCTAGQYSAIGATECSKCPARHISVPDGPVPCERCEKGQVVVGGKCKDVDVGKYQGADDNQLDCGDDSMTMKNGEFNPGKGSDACKKCKDVQTGGKNWYQPAGNSSMPCVLIPAGKKRLNAGNNTIENCPNGTKSPEGADSCADCDGGTFSTEGAGECTSCEEGFYSGDKASVCLEPDAGYFSTDKKNVEYCGDGSYSHGSNRTLCVTRKNDLSTKNNGKSDKLIRIKFNLDQEHVIVARTRCGDNELLEGEHIVEGTDLATLVADNDGFTGRCRCVRPFGATAASGAGDRKETDDTTGCANSNGQCVERLSCAGSCNRKDRSASKDCEVVYAKANKPGGGSICVGYHGNIPTKWHQTWVADLSDADCSDAVVSTLSPDLIQ